jgi:hypothetical protein
MKGLKTNEKKGIFVAADTSKMPFEYIRRDISTGIIISRCTRPDPANSDVSILHHTVDPDGSRKVTMMLPDGSLVGALTFGSDKKLNIEKSIYKPNWKNYIQNYVAHAPAQK